jgi:hypothetical protein
MEIERSILLCKIADRRARGESDSTALPLAPFEERCGAAPA